MNDTPVSGLPKISRTCAARSNLHGSSLSDGLVRVGEEKVSFDEARKRATNALWKVIRHFLPVQGWSLQKARVVGEGLLRDAGTSLGYSLPVIER